MMKWIRRPRSKRFSLLMSGVLSPLSVGNQTLVCLQELRSAHLSCHLQSPHLFIADFTTCPLWRARCFGTESQSTPTPSEGTDPYLSSKALLLDRRILLPDFLAKADMAKSRALDLESVITGSWREIGRCLERITTLSPPSTK